MTGTVLAEGDSMVRKTESLSPMLTDQPGSGPSERQSPPTMRSEEKRKSKSAVLAESGRGSPRLGVFVNEVFLKEVTHIPGRGTVCAKAQRY